MTKKKLSPKQKLFIELWDGDIKKTALAAGYSPNTAQKSGYKNTQNPKIIAAIQARESKRLRPQIAKREDRQAFWTKTMLDPKQKMSDRLKASELLGKSEGDFLERVEATGKDGGPLLIMGEQMTAEAVKAAREIAKKVDQHAEAE